MQKTFIKKLLLLFSAVGFISYGIIWACADAGWDEYSYSAFTPEAFVDSTYRPFFFSDEFYYDIGHDDHHVSRFNEIIVKEWHEYLGKSFSEKEISYFLIEASKAMIDSVQIMPTASLPSTISSMQLVQSKQRPKVAALFSFLTYAKANETYAVKFFDYWNYDDDRPHKYVLNNDQLAVLKSMEKEFNNSSDLFIKQRYFFQMIRAYFFGSQYKACIDFYEKHQSLFPKNILAARCLSYIAGCFYKQKNYAQANYLYSKVYDVSPDFKTVAHFSFHPQNETDWKQTLALCKSKEEQITLWHLLGIYFDEQRAIREIYLLNPKSEKLDLLLLRLVNMLEAKANMGNDYGFERLSRIDSMPNVSLNLVSRIADERKTSKPYLWYLAAGYLNFLKADYTSAQSFYNKAKKTLPKDNLSQSQHRLLVFMNRLAGARKLDQQTEELLLPDLLWLQNFNIPSAPHFRYAYAYDWAKAKMADRYADQHDTLKSELFHYSDSFYVNPSSVNAIKIFLQKQTLSPFEAYCKTIYPIKLESIFEYQSILLTYQDKIDEALNLMKESGQFKDAYFLGNPFNGNIKDCHDCDHAAKQKIKYSKLSFLQKLQELKSNVVAGNDVYNNALLLGNAFYNITHYGNGRFFYEGQVIGSGHSAPYSIPGCFVEMLVDVSIAKHYYQKALAAATNDEEKAKVNYLLLKVERNEWYNKLMKDPNYNSWNYQDIPPINFSVLKAYKNTRYYKEVLNECGYFRNYLAKHP